MTQPIIYNFKLSRYDIAIWINLTIINLNMTWVLSAVFFFACLFDCLIDWFGFFWLKSKKNYAGTTWTTQKSLKHNIIDLRYFHRNFNENRKCNGRKLMFANFNFQYRWIVENAQHLLLWKVKIRIFLQQEKYKYIKLKLQNLLHFEASEKNKSLSKQIEFEIEIETTALLYSTLSN